jgi:uncharacterized protein YijF (DUF1287 family)
METLLERQNELEVCINELKDLKKDYKELKKHWGLENRNTVVCHSRICRLADWIKFERINLKRELKNDK